MTECPVCKQLMARFEEMERHYAQAIFALTSIRQAGKVEDYLSLRRLTDEVRLDAESARFKMETHKGVHSELAI